MNDLEIRTLLLTVSTAIASTLIILPPGLMVAWVLARKNFPFKSVVETFVSLPLIMPPVATGLVLLKLLGKRGLIGQLFHQLFQTDIVFTWRAVIAAMAVMSFPFIVRTARVAFEEVNPRLEQVARTLGSTPWEVFRRITMPLAKRGIMAGCALAFGRALGEFGATVLVAGNIPGKTATLSVSIFYLIQLGQDALAFRLVLLSLIPCFIALWMSEFILRRRKSF
ncbi:molybdate ABC transporter permease subunit [bacterium]|nr:molybdate ABC transporter permease subunit [bacterium]